MFGLILFVVVAILVIVAAASSFVIVRTREAAIIERFGKFQRVAHAGLSFKIPFIDTVRSKISLQVRQLNVQVETKTKDNVFVQIPVAVQYQVVEGREREAFYMLSNHEQQIIAYVQDNVRSSVASMNLDDSFSSKDTIAHSVASSLRDNMAAYGWNFVNTLVTDVRPDARVRDSMNSINAAQREREAAIAQAEAEKIRVVKEAEGAAEARKLQGRGVAEQRKEIVEGIAAQYEMLRNAGVQENPEALMLVSQYLDAMVDVASRSHTKVMYMPSNPQGMGDLFAGMRDVLLSTNAVTSTDKSTMPAADKKSRKPVGFQKASTPAPQTTPESVNPPAQPYGDTPQLSGNPAQSASAYFAQLKKQLES